MSIEKVSYSLIVQEQRPFTTLYSEVIQNVTDMCALGVYTYLSSLPHDWKVNLTQLMNHFNVGKDKIRSVMKWLKDHYLIQHSQTRNEDGTMGQSLIIVKDGRDFINNVVINHDVNKNQTVVDKTVSGKSVSGKSATTYINNNTYTNNNNKTKERSRQKRARPDVPPIVLPDWLDKAVWDEFVSFRVKGSKGRGFTEYAKKLIINELTKFREQGQDPVEVINQSIRSNWMDVYPLKTQGAANGNGNGRKEKFDGLQYLLDKRRARQSRGDTNLFEIDISVEDSEPLRLEGTDGSWY